MVVWQNTEANVIKNNSDRFNKFMNQCLRDRTYCSVSFWDVGCGYEFAKTPANDWIGIKHTVEFEYNP